MKLLASTTSPFVRKVLLAIHELGLQEQVEIEWVVTTVLAPHAAVGAVNPLIKIPSLVTDDGEALFDSRVILEYLQTLSSHSLLPATGKARFAALRTQALADGILDAAITVFYELAFRPKELHFDAWIAAQSGKAMRGLKELESTLPAWSSGSFDVGQISVAALVGWLVFRPNALPGARAAHPTLFAWYDSLDRPSLAATLPRAPS